MPREIKVSPEDLDLLSVVDHINYDGLDNRRENLQILSSAENTRRRRLNFNNTSGIRGISQRKSGSWHAQICYMRKVISIGTYATKENAAIAYDAVLQFVTKINQENTPYRP